MLGKGSDSPFYSYSEWLRRQRNENGGFMKHELSFTPVVREFFFKPKNLRLSIAA